VIRENLPETTSFPESVYQTTTASLASSFAALRRDFWIYRKEQPVF